VGQQLLLQVVPPILPIRSATGRATVLFISTASGNAAAAVGLISRSWSSVTPDCDSTPARVLASTYTCPSPSWSFVASCTNSAKLPASRSRSLLPEASCRISVSCLAWSSAVRA
jgi:hypothetical protein